MMTYHDSIKKPPCEGFKNRVDECMCVCIYVSSFRETQNSFCLHWTLLPKNSISYSISFAYRISA